MTDTGFLKHAGLKADPPAEEKPRVKSDTLFPDAESRQKIAVMVHLDHDILEKVDRICKKSYQRRSAVLRTLVERALEGLK